MKIYVASPYETLLKNGVSLENVILIARFAVIQASLKFSKDDILYSPVLDIGESHKDIKREEAMAFCFKKLKECDVLFIPKLDGVKESEGIYKEYTFARKNGINTIFRSAKIKKYFKTKKEIEIFYKAKKAAFLLSLEEIKNLLSDERFNKLAHLKMALKLKEKSLFYANDEKIPF